MHLTPNEAFEHIRESLVQYTETAYKIVHPAVFAERAEMLRQRGIMAQLPFIEATPSFPTGAKLAALERDYPAFVPSGLAELVQHGVPVDRFPLYVHQQEALIRAFSNQPNLLVATGTGSGKTEAFLLPILSDILREARQWKTSEGLLRGEYNADADVWRPSRRREKRPAAIRAVILYPMNALVNDQLSRLRRILARGDSPDWQRRNLSNNVIHFGMYTGLTQLAGSWIDEWRRDKFAQYFAGIEADWQKLRGDLRDTGGWARPDSPEMICRWDMQAAPPDIMVTNYSMLEYMLVRPIENPMFGKTREWLEENEDARLTLVLDEAHTYTGAKGAEVSYLVRRLKERLGIGPGSSKFRAIATSASIPNMAAAEERLRRFVSDLFGEPSDRFSLIQLPSMQADLPERHATERAFRSFATFHKTFDLQDPMPAIDRLAADLDTGIVDHTVAPTVALHNVLEHNPDIAWVRQRTARNATLLDRLAEECWEALGTDEERAQATAGLLAAGSFSRAVDLPDTPPLLSMRIHAFFRGVTGFWACMDPNCPKVSVAWNDADNLRPVGKLYTDARPWCECGARVLEVFTCRHCGLLHLGGIPDEIHGSLWPWSDDLSGERQDIRDFRVFGVESPLPRTDRKYRSTRTTLSVQEQELCARPVYEVVPTTETVGGQTRTISPFPNQCPRCFAYRAPGDDGREVIEPLRTRGPQSFSAVVGEGFRNQPRAKGGGPPNYGRKSLLFSDSRMEAAVLAGNMRINHHADLFRQLLYRVLYACPTCAGTGRVEEAGAFVIGQELELEMVRKACDECAGSGRNGDPSPIGFQELRGRVIDLEIQRGINPTNDEVGDFFAQLEGAAPTAYTYSEIAFNVAMRRELAEVEFALEPLGLASWRVLLPEKLGQFDPMTEDETRVFIRSIARILATENALLPPEPYKPWEWPNDLVKDYERCVVVPALGKGGKNIVPYNLEQRRKLGRYVIRVGMGLMDDGRLAHAQAIEAWVKALKWPLYNALQKLRVLQWAGAKIFGQVPQGIRIDSFELHPLSETVQRCRACSYIMSETLFDICIRCGRKAQTVSVSGISNYYRRMAQYALPSSGFDDPYPLRSSEHTAQIGSLEARNEERWFQDLFHDDQNSNDHRVDILSVTTTMEMGIDIGSLLSVGLRNVPPSVANYQQRAGRAGRRGSALATVLTYAQPRSHDQYYFDRPPEIVSDPPRVPALYLDNEVIARRHIRAMALQAFFQQLVGHQVGRPLFQSWGTIADYVNHQTGEKLRQFLLSSRTSLVARCAKVVGAKFQDQVGHWLDDLSNEVQEIVNERGAKDQLFEELITSGMLPKYAFPVDVVSLSVPADLGGGRHAWSDDGESNTEEMQRDLKIALSEYALGAEVVRGSFPSTFKYTSAGIYDPFDKKPDYRPTGMFVECMDCQSVSLLSIGGKMPTRCSACQSTNIMPLQYLKPPGFTVDAALPEGGRQKYEGEGRERSGYAPPARLLLGETSFSKGQPQKPYASSLYTHVREGNLFVFNKGPNPLVPGYLICPRCGRSLDIDNAGPHTYPADIPPQQGWKKGPRAGDLCPNISDFQNQVVLGYGFHSQVILLGADLPDALDAPYRERSGQAIWYSFGTLIANAAARVLQLDPGELKTGARAVSRGQNRLLGEVYLYDDVPGGAGYAQAIGENMEAILNKALELGRTCSNPSCAGACYHCMYDYRNWMLHPILDRALGTAVIEYLLDGTIPTVSRTQMETSARDLEEFARANWMVQPGMTVNGTYLPVIFESPTGDRIGLWVIHPLSARPSLAERQVILAAAGIQVAVHTTFDLDRRPFWVMNRLVQNR